MREGGGWQIEAGHSPAPVAAPARWGLPLLGFWAAACVWLLSGRWAALRAMALPDGDDAMRLLQVRAWLGGQRWFDLAQHRLDPASGGADIHWSRLVDLPLAALIAPLTPLVGAPAAEAFACAAVPLLTLLVAMALSAAIVRRAVAPEAWAWGPAILLMASPALGMMQPGRIDHHGWQIAALLATVLGLIDTHRRRGGVLAGLSVAASLAIGVEMLPYLALAGAAAALAWVADGAERDRLRAFTAACGLGTALALFAFVPPANRFSLHCDALGVAYAGPLLLGCAGLVAASFAPLASSRARAAAMLGAGLLAALPLLGPARTCLLDPYAAVDPEARGLWLSHVAEALPLARQSTEVLLASLVLPVIGLVGAGVMLAGGAERRLWLLIVAVSALGILLSLAQTRSGITAQAMAVPGAAALGRLGRQRLRASGSLLARVGGSVLLFLCVAGLLPRLAVAALAGDPSTPAEDARDARNAACMAPSAMAKLDALPPGIFLATIDATPHLLLHTHHDGVAGPYHRNGRAIADVMHAWAAVDPRSILARHRVSYVLACGDPAEAQLYAKRAPDGLSARLARGQAPGWLRPLPLAGTPWRAWRIAY